MSLSDCLFLITKGHSLSCYNCASVLGSCTQTTSCSSGFTNCFSATLTLNSSTVKLKSCAPSACPSGTINYGIGKGSSLCCNTDLCRACAKVQEDEKFFFCTRSTYNAVCTVRPELCKESKSAFPPADSSTNTPNGRSCYYCDGQSCSKTVSCSGTEDRCFNATVFSSVSTGAQSQVLKGCVSKSFCDATALISYVQNASCCEASLCNNAKSVTQSFLFLCCSLLSFILLH
ncbi:Urokinase plasminogen activator surface receptor [Labeo rohita]|uniref:Urokinase plasminogen activator surface receptor n=1 Tax=Labeo rohita TaxID=84645 RepID=A0ABQ8L3V9_LABRO|nr:Urokinase plasminogen activator surface receptor [Labeo rohita]